MGHVFGFSFFSFPMQTQELLKEWCSVSFFLMILSANKLRDLCQKEYSVQPWHQAQVQIYIWTPRYDFHPPPSPPPYLPPPPLQTLLYQMKKEAKANVPVC